MNSTEKCTVCGGSGKYSLPNDYSSTACPMEQICHGCDGKGWVAVEQIWEPFWNYDKSSFTVVESGS